MDNYDDSCYDIKLAPGETQYNIPFEALMFPTIPIPQIALERVSPAVSFRLRGVMYYALNQMGRPLVLEEAEGAVGLQEDEVKRAVRALKRARVFLPVPWGSYDEDDGTISVAIDPALWVTKENRGWLRAVTRPYGGDYRGCFPGLWSPWGGLGKEYSELRLLNREPYDDQEWALKLMGKQFESAVKP